MGWSSLCRADEQRGRYDAALDYRFKAASLAPTDYSSLEALGIVLIKVGDLRKRSRCWNKRSFSENLLEADPVSGWLPHTLRLDAPAMRSTLFCCQWNGTRLKRIHSYYFPRPIGDKANATEAVQAAEAGLKYSPAFAPLHMLLGDFSLTQGDRDMAITHYQHAIVADPNLSEAKTKIKQLETP